MATQTERREATQRAILAAARALFSKRGFEPTSVDDIATAAKVAKGAVYHHFPTKEAIFEQVFLAVTAEVFTEVARVGRAADDPLSSLIVGTRAYFKCCTRAAEAQIMLRDGPKVLGWEKWREIDSKYFGQKILNCLSEAMKAGLIKVQPIEPLSRILIGALTEAAAACSVDGHPGPASRQYLAAFESLVHGLCIRIAKAQTGQ